MHEQIEAVEAVLKEIGNNVPVLRVYNKIDASGDEPRLVEAAPNQPDRVYVSAYTGAGINLLKQAVQTCLMGQLHDFELTLPASAGKLRNQLYQLNVVRNEQTLDNGYSVLQVHLAQDQLQQLIGKAQLLPREVLLPHQAALFERPLEHFEQTPANQAQSEPTDESELAFDFDDENHSLITQEQVGQLDDALLHPLEKPRSSS